MKKKVTIVFLFFLSSMCVIAQDNIQYNIGKKYCVVYYNRNDSINDLCEVDSMVFFINGDSQQKQKIVVPENSYPCNTVNDPLYIGDFNFDGYKDISLIRSEAGPNIVNYFWLYDVSKNKYIRCHSLEKLSSVQIDSSNKTIISSWRENAALYGEAHYKWSHDKLILIEEKEINFDANAKDNAADYVLITTKKPIRGKLIVVSRRKVKRDKLTKKDTVWW